MSSAQVGNLKAGEHHVMACLPAQRSPRRAGEPRRPEFRRPGPHALGQPSVLDSTVRSLESEAKGQLHPKSAEPSVRVATLATKWERSLRGA